MKKFLIGGAALLLLGAAPVIPTPNGVISVAVCQTSKGEVQIQIPDEQYARMGQAGGYDHNPSVTDTGTGEPVKCAAAYQYPADQDLTPPSPKVATSSKTYIETEETNLKWKRNFTDDDTTSLFQILTPKVEAAIARDNWQISTGGSGTSKTNAYTNTAGNILVVFVWRQGTATPSTVTYNGVSMTYIASVVQSGEYIDSFYLVSPATGANNIVATYGSSIYMQISAASYTDSATTGQPDGHDENAGSASATSVSGTITVTAANSWVVAVGEMRNGGPSAVGTGVVTKLGIGGAVDVILLDSNGPVAAGAQSYGFSGAVSGPVDLIGVSIAPPSATSPPPQFIIFE